MSFSKKLWIFYIIYIVALTTIFVAVINNTGGFSRPTFFTNYPYAFEELDRTINKDYNSDSIFLTRLLHNKPLVHVHTFLVSVFRSTNLAFVFSLSDLVSPYEARIHLPILYPIELPLFLFSVFYLLKTNLDKKLVIFLVSLGVFSIVFIGLFLPYQSLLKMIPLTVFVRTVNFIGVISFLRDKEWLNIS